jgi:hypothetical protein
MSPRFFPRGAALSILVVVLAAWTTRAPGITFKIRTQLRNHAVPEKSKPDSVRIKRLAAEAAARASDDVAVGADAPIPGRGVGGTGDANNVLMMTGAFISGLGRMDVQGVIGSTELTATQSALFTDTTSTVVDEAQKTYWARVFDIGSILAFTSAVDNPRASVGMLAVSWDSLPAETYEGRLARHFRLRMRYGLGQRGREDSLKALAITDVTSDYWVEDLPVNFENRFAGIGRPRRPVPDSLRAEWDKMLGLYAQLGKGTIVRFSATGIIGENGPRALEYTRTMEMTDIKPGDVDEAALKVPADFMKVTPQRGRGGD